MCAACRRRFRGVWWPARPRFPSRLMRCLVASPSIGPGMRCLCCRTPIIPSVGEEIMAIKRRSIVAIGVFALLAVLVAVGHWYETRQVKPTASGEKDVVVHVTNAGDRGPGTLREALFIVAAATGPRTISIEVPAIRLETALPALVSGHGVKLVGQASGTQIDAQVLNAGPVFDV